MLCHCPFSLSLVPQGSAHLLYPLRSLAPRPSFAITRSTRRARGSRAAVTMSSGSGSGSGKEVCVTGASGYIASWIVKFLLQRGYTVRASVRDPANAEKTEHLRSLDGAAERLHLFKANLLEEGSFDAGVEGCDGVIHTASPFYFAVTDPQAELIEPAVKGTLNVLSSCKKASTKRVVLTSSMAAVVYNDREQNPEVVVDETWWSSPEACERDKQWYLLSKTLAEDSAWKFAKENALDLVTINPAMVLGPLLQPTLNTSSANILQLINGSSTYPNLSFGWVNVQDVAMAHIKAFELPSASGRHCLVERVAHYSELVKIIHELYPALKLPEKCADDKPFAPIFQVSKEKFRSLGLEYIPLETSIKETIDSLKEKNFVKF
ncbi:cinnamoyl-CoA reductase 2 [Canna indica]|uniref:Cinnamoyl-CoA reductase 2 n=1 Tax=Canna indica TaxID=4628 RepID=A0AAQ3QPW9_9LILI|nr:cinnamoyl-CoA reductase 2 [Canna indica]